MNTKKLFDKASKAGFSVFEAKIHEEEKISVGVFNGEVESFTVAGNASMKLRGILDGKGGSFNSDRTDDGVIDMAVDAVKESAKYGKPADPEFFIKAGEYQYKPAEAYYKALEAVPADKLVELAKSISANALKADKRAVHAEVGIEYDKVSSSFTNSLGLDLTDVMNIMFVTASLEVRDGEQIESSFEYEVFTDIKQFNEKEFVSKLVKRAVDQLGGKSVDSGKYDVVYAPECIATLVGPILEGLSAFNVEQHISLLEGKQGQEIFSPKFTVEEKTAGKGPFRKTFDAEGVPCSNKAFIDKGVVKGFAYDLATAKRAGVKSTGNGAALGGNIRPGIGYSEIKGGDKTIEQLFETVGNGLYITGIQGAHAGLNAQSGNYSLQASGYLIENGKIVRPVSLITVASNVLIDFKNIIDVGSELKLTYLEMSAPAMAISGISVSGLVK